MDISPNHPRQEPPRLAGVLLAGGRSTRFGSEKAVAPFRGRPMMDWSLAALLAVCEAVAVSAPAASGAATLAREHGLPVLADDPAWPEGPLAGVAAGISWARTGGVSRLVTLPCDAPLVRPAHLRRLIAGASEHGAFAVTAEGPEPLVAIWPVACFPARLAGHPPIHALLRALAAAEIAFDDAAVFTNVNEPGRLSRLGDRGGRRQGCAE